MREEVQLVEYEINSGPRGVLSLGYNTEHVLLAKPCKLFKTSSRRQI